MDMLDVLRITSSGMHAQRTRMETIATNMANVHSTRTEEGGPFVKKEVVFTPSDVSPEKQFGSVLEQKLEGVKVSEVVDSQKPFEQLYDPFHPDADADGYVTLSNVNVMEEMSDMMAATRAYEANVNMAGNVKQMFMKSLEIGQ
ncbi:MAG: flagellar basal body rod protein FlgC [Syntrophorhabdales bacterium]|jgi:flagellar basal-body rod protein FlgC